MYPRDIVAVIITSVVMICIFTFVSINAWAEQRRKEREAFYRSEVLKKLAESTGEQAQQVLDLIREQDRAKDRHRRSGLKLGGLIVTGVGIGLCVMLGLQAPGGGWAVGLIPLLVGVAMLVYGFVLAPRLPEEGRS
jgi:hypothetical protein